jgi:hypothetical protein
MKRQLLIEVDCGKVVCDGCDWFNKRDETCAMFEVSLVDDCVRDKSCLVAEQRATALIDDLKIAEGRYQELVRGIKPVPYPTYSTEDRAND